MKRSEQREHIFKLVFGFSFYEKEEIEGQSGLYFEEFEGIPEGDREYIQEKARRIAEDIKELDEVINESSTGWKTSRMNKVDLSILRLAVYEMEKDETVPVSVAINEAVELAKKFGGKESPSFVNGVLAKLARQEKG